MQINEASMKNGVVSTPTIVPTHSPNIRIDENDQIFRTRREKFNAVVARIEHAHASALPLLRHADLVELGVCETEAAGRVARDVQMADPLPWLARHGVRATLQHHTLGGSGRFNRNVVGEALLSLADDSAADLLVMGAYAHSRLRETFLGGVTRTVLAHMHLPVLLEH